MKLALFSAFPQELRHILRNCPSVQQSRTRPFPLFFKKHLSCKIIGVQTGMNVKRVESAVKYIVEEYRPDVVLSIGFGGALSDGARIGDLLWASRYLLISEEEKKPLYEYQPGTDPGATVSGEIFDKLQDKISINKGSFVTLSEWMTKSRVKKIIPRDIPFPVCDRETFHLAKLSHQNSVPFFAIRAITDRADEDIPAELFTVTDEAGNYRFSRALGLLLHKPRLIPASIKLGRNSAIASKNLWHAVKSLVEVLSSSARLPSRIKKPSWNVP
jgi:nucleoside phosphorylase